MAQVKEVKKRKKRREHREEPSPAPGIPAKTQAFDRRGLWVVVSGRMKQYGDYLIESPGQIIRQQYLRNDDLLLKHHYVKPLQDQEDVTQCKSCGLMFLGTITIGPYKSHLAYARHDLAKTDLDADMQHPAGRRPPRVGDEANPDADNAGEWDLEPDGTPPATKLEDESPGGVRVSM